MFKKPEKSSANVSGSVISMNVQVSILLWLPASCHFSETLGCQLEKATFYKSYLSSNQRFFSKKGKVSIKFSK